MSPTAGGRLLAILDAFDADHTALTLSDLARRAAELGVDVLPGHTAIEIVETLKTQLAPGDVLVTLGAGDVWKLRPAGKTRGRK